MSNKHNKKMRQRAKKLDATYHPKSEGKSPFMDYDHPNAIGRVAIQDGDNLNTIKARMEYIPKEYTRWVKQCGSYDKRHRHDSRIY